MTDINYSIKNILLEIPDHELQAYQKGILGVLAKVELDSCDQSLKEDIKSAYKLLGHLMIENRVPEFINPKPQLL